MRMASKYKKHYMEAMLKVHACIDVYEQRTRGRKKSQYSLALERLKGKDSSYYCLTALGVTRVRICTDAICICRS